MPVELDEELRVKSVMYYAGHILAIYQSHVFIDIFRVNGPHIERLEINSFFTETAMKAQSIDFIMMPRLDWQDRDFDTQQRAQKQLPRKIILCGTYDT